MLVMFLVFSTSWLSALDPNQQGLDYTTLQDANGRCAWVRDVAGSRRTLAQLPARCSEVLKISLNGPADRALVALDSNTKHAMPRFFGLDLKDPNSQLAPLPTPSNKAETWFDLLFDRKNQRPVLFTIAPAKPEDKGPSHEQTLHIYDLQPQAWSLRADVYPQLQTDETPNPATEAYWDAGFIYASFDSRQGEGAGPREASKEQLVDRCRKHKVPVNGSLWDDSRALGLCWAYPEGGEGWSTLTGSGGLLQGEKNFKTFEIPDLSGLSAGNSLRIQT